eukprot:Em0219g4a
MLPPFLPFPIPASPDPVGTLTLNSPSVDQLTVAWAPPTTGGVPTSYNVSINDSSSPVVIPDNGSSLYTHTFTGLTSDTLYTVSVVAINCAGTSNVTSVYKRTFKWQGGIGSKNRQEAVEEKQISISGPTPTRIAVVLAGTGVGGEEVPVAIRKYFEDIAILLRNHPTVLPTTMLGLTRIDKNEAIVVRTTMASQQLGISPDAMLREIAYSHSRCFGKGERKFCFKVEGGYQQANCLGVYLCCLPATLKQELKTLLEVPAQLPAPAQGPSDIEDVAQNPLQPAPFEGAGDAPRPAPEGTGGTWSSLEAAAMHSLPSVGLATSTPIRGPHGWLGPPPPPTPPVCGVLAGPRLAPVEGAGDAPRPAPEGTGAAVPREVPLAVRGVPPANITPSNIIPRGRRKLQPNSYVEKRPYNKKKKMDDRESHQEMYTLHQQSSLLEQSSMQQSVHEPLCFVEHTKYLLCDKFVNIKERVHIFSSFFLGKLMESPKDRKRSHWFVAIVCFPEKFESDNAPDKLEVDSEDVALSTQDLLTANPSPTRPCIIVLDSLGIKRAAVLKSIQSYLTEEWKVKRSTEKNFSSMPQSYPSTGVPRPAQASLFLPRHSQGIIRCDGNDTYTEIVSAPDVPYIVSAP